MNDVSWLDAEITKGESLDSEFKSDRQKLSDSTIYEEVVALANTDGGLLLIGVEDSGIITGSQNRHGVTTDARRLQAAIFNNTVPSINTRVRVVDHPQGRVIVLEVDSYPEPCSTASGKCLRRAWKVDGKPETIPWHPRDHHSRRIDLGLLDFSAQRLPNLKFEDLDPLEFQRIRNAIARLKGDKALTTLPDREFAQALKIVETVDGELVPNVAGVLVAGKSAALEESLPTHSVHFQVIDADTEVRVNDSFRKPLLALLEEIELRFKARNQEREISVGLFRIPVPDYSVDGFRESINNAVLHRDYSRNDGVYVQWHHDHMLITNPGGFPEGITLRNLLVHEPKPRNTRLAEVFKRVGLIEQTGRGIDRVYRGQLLYGRPLPDYSRSDERGVRVVLPGGAASLQFAAFVFEQDRAGTPLSFDELIVLYTLESERRCDSAKAGELIQKGAEQGRQVLERLVERGFIEAKGERRGRVYHLSAAVYRKLGIPSGYVRTHGIDSVRHEALILEAVAAHGGKIERKHVIELLGLSGEQAGRLLRKMCDDGKLKRHGSPPRWTYYVLFDP